MANQSKIPPKFVLNEKLWKNLPSQYLEDSLLCARPEDAVKWLLVSKDIKEVIEENRGQMRRYKKVHFIIGDNMTLRCGDLPLRIYRRLLRIQLTGSSTESTPLLEYDRFENQSLYEYGGEYYTLNDSSAAGKMKLVRRIVDWFETDQLLLLMKSQEDVEMVRPFVDGHVIICIAKWRAECDDSVVDAIEDLRVQNLEISYQVWTQSAIQRLQTYELEALHLSHIVFLPWIRCNTIFYKGSLTYKAFEDFLVIPWYDGDLPHLKVFRFEGSGLFPCIRSFERIPYVSTFEERAENNDFMVHAYVLEDRSRLHLMEVKLVFIEHGNYYHPSHEYLYVFVNIVY